MSRRMRWTEGLLHQSLTLKSLHEDVEVRITRISVNSESVEA